MEALSFFKFWRPTKENQTINENNDTITTTTIEVDSSTPSPVICSVSEFDDDEEDDSFFELELTVSDSDNQKNNHNNKESQQQTTTATFSSLSSTDVLSKRKILPIETSTNSKPQSPISLFKSAPKFRVTIFKKPKSMATEKTEISRKQSKLFTIKFKVDEVSNLSMFTRASSFRKTQHKESINDSSSSSKGFSRDVIQKYLKLIKPFYVKVSKKNEKMGFAEELTAEATSSSSPPPPANPPKKEKKGNIPAGFKHLGKSKSASASVMSPARRDDSLLLQHDGIQSAILHCKNSFHSRDSSSLSRSTSTSSQETFSNLFSRDSSLLSRFSSDSSSSEFTSATKSNEEKT